MTKTLQDQLKEAEQRAASQEMKVAQIREKISKEENRKAKVLASVIQKAVKMPYFSYEIGKLLHHHADEKEQKILTEFLKIKVIYDSEKKESRKPQTGPFVSSFAKAPEGEEV